MSAREPLEALLALVKRQPHGEPARRDTSSFQIFEARLQQRQAWRFRARAGALAACAGALLVCLVWLIPRRSDEAALRYEVVRDAYGHEAAGAAGVSRLRFSDGSSVAIGQETQAHVGAATAHGAEVVLTRGSLEAMIVPRAGGDWWFEAGPFRVHVTGTAFSLRWRPEQGEIEVVMLSGSVEVTGPLVERGVRVQRGERLVAALREDRLTVEPVAPPAAPAVPAPSVAAAPALEEPAAEAAEDEGPADVSGRRAAPERVARAFPGLVARGDFAEVVRQARALGLARLLSHAPPSVLSALADAARYEGDEALAARVLGALRARFRSTPSGLSAAYFLARVSHGERAEQWYRAYLAEQPEGAFSAPAWGALMVLQQQRGDRTAARDSARAYLRKEPSGPYAAAARRILGGDGESTR